MKVCNYPHKYLLVDYFDGTVWVCPWMAREHGIIGNMLESSLEDVWHGEEAENIRLKTASGDFSYCRITACPFLQNDSLPDLCDSEIKKICVTAPTPKFINLAHDYICNLSCETCRPSPFTPPKNYGDRIKKINNLLAPFLDRADTISLSGHGDPFASPYMLRLMMDMCPKSTDTTINLETNGVLFTPQNWKKISHLANVHLNVIITVNSFDEFTYKHISRGGNYTALMKNLHFISGLRQEGYIKKLELAMVIQDRNFRQMPEFAATCLSRYACDRVLLRPVYQWGTMPDHVYWFKDVLNPMHPYHPEYLELLDHPALSDPRVYHFGGHTLHPARPYPQAGGSNDR